jgi:hypothetical protein
MGLDLSLLPVEHEHIVDKESGKRWGFSHSLLAMDRDYNLFDAWQTVETEAAPESFSTFVSVDNDYPEPHYGYTDKDPYGAPLRTAKAGVLTNVGVPNSSQRNQAVLAYLAALPAGTPVVLYWH